MGEPRYFLPVQSARTISSGVGLGSGGEAKGLRAPVRSVHLMRVKLCRSARESLERMAGASRWTGKAEREGGRISNKVDLWISREYCYSEKKKKKNRRRKLIIFSLLFSLFSCPFFLSKRRSFSNFHSRFILLKRFKLFYRTSNILLHG